MALVHLHDLAVHDRVADRQVRADEPVHVEGPDRVVVVGDVAVGAFGGHRPGRRDVPALVDRPGLRQARVRARTLGCVRDRLDQHDLAPGPAETSERPLGRPAHGGGEPRAARLDPAVGAVERGRAARVFERPVHEHDDVGIERREEVVVEDGVVGTTGVLVPEVGVQEVVLPGAAVACGDRERRADAAGEPLERGESITALLSPTWGRVVPTGIGRGRFARRISASHHRREGYDPSPRKVRPDAVDAPDPARLGAGLRGDRRGQAVVGATNCRSSSILILSPSISFSAPGMIPKSMPKSLRRI